MGDDSTQQPFTISPKVLYPLALGLVAFLVTGLTSGFWDTANLATLLTTAALTAAGAVAPPAPGRTQRQVSALPRKH